MSCVLQVPTTIASDGHATEGSSCRTPAEQRSTPDRCTTNGSKLTKHCPLQIHRTTTNQVLPVSDLTPRQCFQQSNDANGATITHGFHRVTRTRSRERCRIPSMAPPTRKITPEGIIRHQPRPKSSMTFVREPSTYAGTTSPTHHHQIGAAGATCCTAQN